METNRSYTIAAVALLLTTAAAGAAAHTVWSNGSASNGGAASGATASNGRITFSGTVDRSKVLIGDGGVARLELVMSAADGVSPDGAPPRRATDLVIVLDRSGSMSGTKVRDARAAVRELLARLGAADRFALITYSDGAETTIPLSPAEPSSRAAWDAIVAGVQPSGGTNMASGLDLGLNLIARARDGAHVPRMILISDGLANQGDATPAGLTARARLAARAEYMLSTVGIGADFNEYLMTALADAGTGNYYYVQNSNSLGEVFAREFASARETVANGLAVRIRPAAGVRVVEAAGYPLERDGDGVLFRPGSLFAGQERRVWLTFAVPNTEVGNYALGDVTLSYDDGAQRTTLALEDLPRIACVDNRKQFVAGIDKDAWSRSVTVEAYNKMQEEVAREVKAGRRDSALGRLRKFKDETAALNSEVQSAPVAQQLLEADRLEQEVAGAFAGANQKEKQNELSKGASYRAMDARRVGNKK